MGMDFGQALHAMLNGQKVRRKQHQDEQMWIADGKVMAADRDDTGELTMLKTKHIFATDWEIIDELAELRKRVEKIEKALEKPPIDSERRYLFESGFLSHWPIA